MQSGTHSSGSVEKQVRDLCESCCVPKFSAKSSERIYLQNLHLLFLTHIHSLTILFMHVHTCVLSGQHYDDYPPSTGCDAEDEGCFRQLFSILCESTGAWSLLCLVGWLVEQGWCAALLPCWCPPARIQSCVVCAAPLTEHSFPGWMGDAPSWTWLVGIHSFKYFFSRLHPTYTFPFMFLSCQSWYHVTYLCANPTLWRKREGSQHLCISLPDQAAEDGVWLCGVWEYLENEG